MAKHRKKQAVYHNHGKSTWVNDDKEQLSLLPGSDGYNARQQNLAESVPMSEENIEENVEDQAELEKQSEQFSDNFEESFEKGMRDSASALKYRAMVERQDAVKQTAQIASDGLGREVTPAEIESRSAGITNKAEDVPGVLKTYATEFHQRELPKVDMNNDGKVDEDDVCYTPGMTKMSRYM